MFLGYANLTGLLRLFLQNLEAIEKHFATARAPHLIEHLPDNAHATLHWKRGSLQ